MIIIEKQNNSIIFNTWQEAADICLFLHELKKEANMVLPDTLEELMEITALITGELNLKERSIISNSSYSY